MTKLVLLATAAAVAVTVAAPDAPAANERRECLQAHHDTLVASSPEGTQGDAISDGFYGNEPNIVDPFAPGGPNEQEPGSQAGRVVPSQSPGPKVTNPDGTVREGASWGDVQKTVIKPACNG